MPMVEGKQRAEDVRGPSKRWRVGAEGLYGME